MGVLRLYQEAEWVRFGECTCLGECHCTHFEVHRLGPKAMRDLTRKHEVKRREKWPDGWREVSEVKDSFNEAYTSLVIRGWRNLPGPDGAPLPFTPENLALVREHTGLLFQEFLNDLLKSHQQDSQAIETAELGNSNPG
jgi:hypothetical protein